MRVTLSDLRIRVVPALAAVLLLPLLSLPSSAQVQPFEMGIAGREAGLLRGLAQRLSKQNLLYQLHLAGVRKDDMLETSGEIERIIALLQRGNANYAVPAPWTSGVREQLDATEAAWSVLQPIATASPFEYLRRTRQFMPAENRLGDPLSIRYFDNLSNDLTDQATRLLAAYENECEKTDFPNCSAARSSGLWAMLTQRMVKEAVLVFAGIDPSKHQQRLDEDRATLEKLLLDARKIPLIQDAMSPERGERGAFVAGLLDDIESDWRAFARELKLVLADDERGIDLANLIRIEGKLVGRMQRLNTTVTRYAIGRFGG
jgi:hypothetical protein